MDVISSPSSPETADEEGVCLLEELQSPYLQPSGHPDHEGWKEP